MRRFVSTGGETFLAPSRLKLGVFPLFQGSVHEVRLKGRTRRKVIVKITLADACQAMGGQSVPLQKMQIEEQKPLSADGTPVGDRSEEELKQRSAKFKTPEASNSEDEEEDEWWIDHSGPPSDSEDEEAEDQMELPGIVVLESTPIESITYKQIPMAHMKEEVWEDPDLKADRTLLLEWKEWKDEFFWNYTSRKVTVRWCEFRKEGGYNPRLLKTLWGISGKEEMIGPLFQKTYGKAVKELIRKAHPVEWDREILMNLSKFRREDPTFDYKMACLVYYNGEISRQERDRRLDSLWITAVNKAIDDCHALGAAPKPTTWHRDDNPELTEEMWASIDQKWDKAWEVLDDLYERTIKKRREAFKPFYEEEWRIWGVQFRAELFEFKCQDAQYEDFSANTIRAFNKQMMHWNRVWQERCAKEVDRKQEQAAIVDQELRKKCERAYYTGATERELESIRQEIWKHEDKTKMEVQKILDAWERMDSQKKRDSKFNWHAARWLRSRDSKLATIKSRYSGFAKVLRGLQSVEARELFPPLASFKDDGGTQVAHLDMNEAIAHF
jgi:hypothetical protein